MSAQSAEDGSPASTVVSERELRDIRYRWLGKLPFSARELAEHADQAWERAVTYAKGEVSMEEAVYAALRARLVEAEADIARLLETIDELIPQRQDSALPQSGSGSFAS